jgi:nicotinamide-nucleotide amidase
MENLFELAERAGRALKARGVFLATAESCTGGGIAHAVTEIPGSSEWFECGFVTYSNASKVQMLGVPEQLIARCGAVSEEVAAAMAQGALARSGAGMAVSTTGIAGPGGGSADKPVGTVCFGWAVPDGTRTERIVFGGDRQAVRRQTVAHAIRGILQLIGRAESS